jgi:hypothetical protein
MRLWRRKPLEEPALLFASGVRHSFAGGWYGACVSLISPRDTGMNKIILFEK